MTVNQSTRLAVVSLQTEDLPATAHFYQDVLGLNPLDPNDCPESRCPSSGGILRVLPLILESRDAAPDGQ